MDINFILQNKKYIHEILSTINEEVYFIDENMDIVYVNKAAQKNGFDEDRVLNHSIFKVFPYLKKENSSFVKVFSTGKPVIGSICTYITNRGERKIRLTSTYPIKENGKVIGAYEIGEDISGLSRQSEELASNPKIHNKKDILSYSKDKTDKFYTLDSIIGESPSIKRLKEKLLMCANSQSNVLIYGETGTGKELVAQAIYSLRKDSKTSPFIVQNCAAIPETLLESILFGTVKGSFTGAENRPGLFEFANGGVLFLDEINSMPIGLQAKILRVIQERKVRRVGGEREIPVKFKLISSINVRPQVLLEKGEMRKDLYYRLNVLYFDIPPLRERKEDIPNLVQVFIEKYNKKLNKRIIGIDEKMMESFMDYDWPGNIRELKNIVERFMNMTKGKVIRFDKEEFASYLVIKQKDVYSKRIKKEGRVRLREAVKDLEIQIIEENLRLTRGNISKAARDLDIPQQTLNNKIDKYNLRFFVNKLRGIKDL
ncbi:sigma-54 interaction domain-containing protein [Maledivibacter halophilus]|uniref:Arginine utilization regulatory protein n=1 Tax=Maledivibacter halophilus TaxID=36842 RepID=A0A1T5J4N3_9FIRM|nr:sigma 54-interacting transcriptional regulator [Maledivibacter halophilus]SKC46370.1 arginine utilization regulatory protein [Maledivibacter halophilus]